MFPYRHGEHKNGYRRNMQHPEHGLTDTEKRLVSQPSVHTLLIGSFSCIKLQMILLPLGEIISSSALFSVSSLSAAFNYGTLYNRIT